MKMTHTTFENHVTIIDRRDGGSVSSSPPLSSRSYFRLRAIDPRVTMEFGEGASVKQTSARQTVIATTIDGEVARTAERIGEATALALSASLYAASEQIKGRAPRGAQDLLAGIAAQNLLPPGLALTQVEANLVSAYGVSGCPLSPDAARRRGRLHRPQAGRRPRVDCAHTR